MFVCLIFFFFITAQDEKKLVRKTFPLNNFQDSFELCGEIEPIFTRFKSFNFQIMLITILTLEHILKGGKHAKSNRTFLEPSTISVPLID